MPAGISVLNCQADGIVHQECWFNFVSANRKSARPERKQFQVGRINALFQNPGCPPAQEIEARVGSDGFDEEQQTRRDDKIRCSMDQEVVLRHDLGR